jgi:hypothetical protein
MPDLKVCLLSRVTVDVSVMDTVKQQAAQNASDLASKVVADSMKGSVDKFYDAVTNFINGHPMVSAAGGVVGEGLKIGANVIGTAWLLKKFGGFGDAVTRRFVSRCTV